MRSKTPVTLFPFLSVLISAMGVLSFIAVTFLMFVRQDSQPSPPQTPVEVRWIGAPEHVRPLLVACKEDGAEFQVSATGLKHFFPLATLKEEVSVVKELQQRGLARLGVTPDSYRFWLYMKNAIQQDERLADSFTGDLNDLEMFNLSSEGRRKVEQRYPILLVYPKGVPCYQLASYLLDTTTRLAVGLEPMLEGWSLPYQNNAS